MRYRNQKTRPEFSAPEFLPPVLRRPSSLVHLLSSVFRLPSSALCGQNHSTYESRATSDERLNARAAVGARICARGWKKSAQKAPLFANFCPKKRAFLLISYCFLLIFTRLPKKLAHLVRKLARLMRTFVAFAKKLARLIRKLAQTVRKSAHLVRIFSMPRLEFLSRLFTFA